MDHFVITGYFVLIFLNLSYSTIHYFHREAIKAFVPQWLYLFIYSFIHFLTCRKSMHSGNITSLSKIMAYSFGSSTILNILCHVSYNTAHHLGVSENMNKLIWHVRVHSWSCLQSNRTSRKWQVSRKVDGYLRPMANCCSGSVGS